MCCCGKDSTSVMDMNIGKTKQSNSKRCETNFPTQHSGLNTDRGDSPGVHGSANEFRPNHQRRSSNDGGQPFQENAMRNENESENSGAAEYSQDGYEGKSQCSNLPSNAGGYNQNGYGSNSQRNSGGSSNAGGYNQNGYGSNSQRNSGGPSNAGGYNQNGYGSKSQSKRPGGPSQPGIIHHDLSLVLAQLLQNYHPGRQPVGTQSATKVLSCSGVTFVGLKETVTQLLKSESLQNYVTDIINHLRGLHPSNSAQLISVAQLNTRRKTLHMLAIAIRKKSDGYYAYTMCIKKFDHCEELSSAVREECLAYAVHAMYEEGSLQIANSDILSDEELQKCTPQE